MDKLAMLIVARRMSQKAKGLKLFLETDLRQFEASTALWFLIHKYNALPVDVRLGSG